MRNWRRLICFRKWLSRLKGIRFVHLVMLLLGLFKGLLDILGLRWRGGSGSVLLGSCSKQLLEIRFANCSKYQCTSPFFYQFMKYKKSTWLWQYPLFRLRVTFVCLRIQRHPMVIIELQLAICFWTCVQMLISRVHCCNHTMEAFHKLKFHALSEH